MAVAATMNNCPTRCPMVMRSSWAEGDGAATVLAAVVPADSATGNSATGVGDATPKAATKAAAIVAQRASPGGILPMGHAAFGGSCPSCPAYDGGVEAERATRSPHAATGKNYRRRHAGAARKVSGDGRFLGAGLPKEQTWTLTGTANEPCSANRISLP